MNWGGGDVLTIDQEKQDPNSSFDDDVGLTSSQEFEIER